MQNSYRLLPGAVFRQTCKACWSALIPLLLLLLVSQMALLALTSEWITPPAWLNSWLRGPLPDLVIGVWLMGATTDVIARTLTGAPTALPRAAWTGVTALPRVLIVYVLLMFGASVGMLLALVPGLLVLTAYFVAIPSSVLERRWLSAYSRSERLTAGTMWSVLLVVLAYVAVVSGIPLMALGCFLLTDTDPPQWLLAALGIFISFGVALQTVCYHRLRTEKEAVNSERVAAVFH